ncbi:sulfatase-like hydrolase/transferase [Confluentibacter lentus]|uniref:sulfatase-like hydrolase/transferase n=1 Tax=Confluentibacter lentus TaxID=1699412 RepID=UPI000C28FCE3|nr:sulfatase-like hydrolase/transferase [Confluentibacter lentus]
MKINLKTEHFNNYIKLTFALIIAFWVLSVYEVINTQTSQGSFLLTLFLKFINDFWCGIVIGIIIFPLFFLINNFKEKLALNVVMTLFIVLVLGQFSLIKYSLTTLLNLGADLLGYSFDDVSSTVSTSESVTIFYFLPFIIFPALLLVSYVTLKKYVQKPVLFILMASVLLFGVLKLVLPKLSNDIYKNKLAFLTYDIIKFKREQRALGLVNLYNREDFPLLRASSEIPDVLSPFLNKNEAKPNIVFLVVEGLGGEFVDNDIYSGFTPYLDSLINKSLYWENFVSTTGRSFGILPALLGSLPYGEKGFLELSKTPSHVSLISLLKANEYNTSYYSGCPSNFDRKINFLEYNGIDQLIDESKYGPSYTKTRTDDGGFSWGYPDHEIFRKALTTMNAEKQPRLDIIMTLSTHEPFEYPDKELYRSKVKELMENSIKSEDIKNTILNNKDVFGCLIYTDNAIKEFMDAYSKRPEYENTIFVITGDHRLIPIAQKDKLCRFHVPFLVYSPMLKKAERFKAVSSHWDVTPTLVSYLSNNFKFKSPEKTSWVGTGLDTVKQFRNSKMIPLMRYKGSLNEVIYKDYFYSDGELYKIKSDFGTYSVVEEDINKTILDSLMAFKKLNAYVTQRNKIFPDSLNIYVTPKKEFSEQEINTINKFAKNKTFDEVLEIARELSFKKQYETSRLLCDFILNEYPNYTDARILKGRSLGWQGDYDKARVELLDAIKRSPYYDDAYMALLDVYWWSNQESKSVAIYSEALKNEIINPSVSLKMAQAYKRIGNENLAKKIMDSIVDVHPNNSEFLAFKNSLN